MSTPDRRSFDSPRRGSRGRSRDDDFGGRRDEPYVPRDAFVPRGGADRAPAGFGGAPPRGFNAPMGPETSAVVKWFNGEKGFGFVELAGGGGDAFLHISVLSRAGYQTVSPGATLKVLTSAGQKGPQVAEVNSVDESTATPETGGRSGGGGMGMGGGGASGFGGGGGDRPRPAARAPVDMSSAVEMRGTVKWFNAEKGFGFVMPDGGGKDVFVHISALNRGGLSGLEPNQTVKMQVADGRRGPEAVSVENS
jgi:CspA family cold shock protein